MNGRVARCGMAVGSLVRRQFSRQFTAPSTSAGTTLHQEPSQQATVVDEGVQMTEGCVSRIRQVAVNGEFLRLSVDGGGCSGFEYKFALDTEWRPDDRWFERDGARLAVDALSLDFVKGATVDYSEELIRSAFRVAANPQAEKGCSCGASFAVRLD